jgi:quercetin dioxygenase-like cupin family protein
MRHVSVEALALQPVLLEDLAEYQAGSVISRKIIQQPTGAVTLFAFDSGQALSEHTAPHDALVQVIEGEAEVTIAGRPMKVATGEVLLLPANQPHAVKAVQRFKMILTMIHS